MCHSPTIAHLPCSRTGVVQRGELQPAGSVLRTEYSDSMTMCMNYRMAQASDGEEVRSTRMRMPLFWYR